MEVVCRYHLIVKDEAPMDLVCLLCTFFFFSESRRRRQLLGTCLVFWEKTQNHICNTVVKA